MPKHLIRKFMPDHEKVRNHKHLRIFGRLIHDPNIWHLNRRSVSGAFFIGLLCAFVPIFPQMLTSAALAIITRVNLPISVALVWLTNPITIPPMFYFNYLVGCWLLGESPAFDHFEMSAGWIESVLEQIWWPLLLGGSLIGLITGALGFVLMRGFWRWHVVREMNRRKARREQDSPAK
ncbi:MAG: DUF2062 domain-containing protein [Gammaproteobacteria bacterium]|nr:DUF2062 domain-containing protein [Gammaproteobacteria bacterium]MBU1655465.1 DUF2062 domain-containing protein [Gammaproteobacteria bacterium]MBU1959600.1 DUF2062 domain-containing protein [Gammaproteobacteria bacterium]